MLGGKISELLLRSSATCLLSNFLFVAVCLTVKLFSSQATYFELQLLLPFAAQLSTAGKG